MTDGLSISATGVQAAVARFDLLANNIANLTTPGFKTARLDQISLRSGGTAVTGPTIQFSQGPIELTEGGFALAIQGDGFLQLDTPDGPRFTRAGDFRVDASGNLVDPRGILVSPPVQIPSQAESVFVTRDGRVLAILADGSVAMVGQIQTFSIANPGGLLAGGNDLFAAPEPPALLGTSDLVFGALEASTVDLAGEGIDAFLNRALLRANVQALQVQDQTQGALIDILG